MSTTLWGPRLGGSAALQARTGTGSLRAPLRAAQPARRLQVSAALHDPWATLGVSRSASEKEIKQAHRRLVKQHHPDVRKGEDLLAHAQFLRVQEAYELIMGKRAGKDVEGRPAEKSSWDFHDWFWSFKMKRKQGQGQHGAAVAASAAQPEGAAAHDGLQAEAEPQHTHHQQHTPHEQHQHEQQQHHYGSAHARKFANRDDVEERLSSQLAGLKRRAALKQEVQSSC
ncbi:hypothetical protein COHA_003731 [Chlorella ohadii]|uniref:J domain-containing protein n=1 Tax=Chlorella ohadii TaxID=2649997 RepID=A0AAD5DQY5_9CHLO|nr:hypothetical protein COHA_003731 [Chlorella ohadii]